MTLNFTNSSQRRQNCQQLGGLRRWGGSFAEGNSLARPHPGCLPHKRYFWNYHCAVYNSLNEYLHPNLSSYVYVCTIVHAFLRPSRRNATASAGLRICVQQSKLIERIAYGGPWGVQIWGGGRGKDIQSTNLISTSQLASPTIVSDITSLATSAWLQIAGAKIESVRTIV